MKSACERIIVMGGSAGGLEATLQIIAQLPADLAAAICLVLHLNATAPSMLASVLARKTRLRVVAPEDGMPLQCGTVYPAPPDRHLLVESNVLRLGRGPRENNFRPAVDPLFRTAAQAYGSAVIGIVLSGNLDDGTAGLAAIKAAGGIGIVQSPDEALYPGMPASALQEVPTIDHVIEVRGIAPLVVELVGTSAQPAAPLQRGRAVPADIARGGEQPLGVDERKDAESAPSRYGCPACGGMLTEYQEAEMVRFRCRVGHMFSDEALLAAQTESLETALWTALRALEEAAEQADKLHQRVLARGHEQLAQRFARQSRDANRRAAIVREALTYNQAIGEQELGEAS